MISKTGALSRTGAISRADAISRTDVTARTAAGPPDPTPVVEETEAYATLVSLAGDKTGELPATVLAGHIMEVTKGADWPVRRAALEAALRRFASAREDELRVAARPPAGGAFGAYATRRKGQGKRPYATVLHAVEPLAGSCDCRDFLRNSLGLCKHLAAVLLDLAAGPRKLRRALQSGERFLDGRPRLGWEPVRPFTGAGDWLANVYFRAPAGKAPPRGAAWDKALRHFRRDRAQPLRLKGTYEGDPARRLGLVRDLLAVAGPGRREAAPFDPAVRALLAREKRELSLRLAAGGNGRALTRDLRGLKRRLYPYQRAGVKRFLEQGALLLGDDMGLGKTAQAAAACHVLWSRRRVRRGLLLVPNSLKPQWLREWRLFSAVPIETVDGSPSQRAEIYRRTKAGFLVANYEQVWRDLDLMRGFKPDIVILDEAQRIKNWATKTALHVKALHAPYRLVLTGTPMENRLEELASIMDWVDDMALEPKWRLVPWHSMYADGSRQVVGARNLDTLRTRLKSRMLRRVRSEVLDQLPPRTDTVVPVEMTPAQWEEHEALRPPIARLMHIAERRPLSQAEFLKLMQLLTTQRIICNGLAQLRFEEAWPEIEAQAHDPRAALGSLDSPKLAELREILTQVAVEQGRKVVVFSQWRRMLRLAHWAVADVFDGHGLRAAFFTGMESSRRRTRNVVDFHDDPATRVLFCTDAGGVGLNLQRAANCCVNLEIPWNPAVIEQRIGRIHRIGQRDPIDVYNLVTEESIEARIAALVADKRALFQGLFDGTSDEVRFEGCASFLSRLEKVVAKTPAPEPPPIDDDAEQREREIDAVLAAADESRDPEPAPARRPAPAAAPDGLHELLSTLKIESTRSGRVRIEAPAETAGALAALFEGFATLLRSQEAADR